MDKVKLDSKTKKIFQKLGSLGGTKTSEKYGKEHYSKAGKKGGAMLLEKYGVDYFKRIRQMHKKKKD